MDREKLAEAVGLLERSFTHELIDPVIAAARRLLEAEEVWWCNTHRAESTNQLDPPEEQIRCWLYAELSDDEQPGGRCRMVPRLLADPEETG